MAVTYADNTKKIVELYSNGKDKWGRDVERKLGFHKVFFCDEITGAISLGPFIEPVPYIRTGAGYVFPELGPDVIGREYASDSKSGGQFGFWKHLCV